MLAGLTKAFGEVGWGGEREGGGRLDDGETVWEPRDSEQGWLGRTGADLALSAFLEYKKVFSH